MSHTAHDDYLTLTLCPGLGPVLTHRCLKAMGSAGLVVASRLTDLMQVEGIGRKRAEAIRRSLDGLSDGVVVEREKRLIHDHGVTVVVIDEPGYPRLLRHIPDPPPLLYVRGRLREEDALGLGVVGTRRCTAYGREQADRLSAVCSQAGLCIISGGARGVDGAAHRAALRVQGRTIAVLGSGLAKPYPQEHEALFDAIAGGGEAGPGGGAVVSELPMSTPPIAENFPRRNRIISGLALGVLVVEAPLGSGAMITARLAGEDHGRDVLALPGRVDSRLSAGCHKMIREGWATLVTNAADILDALGDAGRLLKAGLMEDRDPASNPRPKPALSASLTVSQRCVLGVLGQPRALDQIVAATGLAVGVIQGDLTVLEIRGLVTRSQGFYARRD